MPDAREQFVDAVGTALSAEAFTLFLSDLVKGAAELPRRQSVRPVRIRGRVMFQWELQFDRQQTHLNLDESGSLQRLREQLGIAYRQATLRMPASELHFQSNSRGDRLRQSASRQSALPVVLEHDQTKPYLIPEGVPCGFLMELDVMTSSGQVRQSRQKKFRQVNRYLELVNDVYRFLPEQGPIRVIDFGCGLSYLTFALHHLLTQIHQREVQLTGIDQNPSVIARCTEIAAKLHLEGIAFTTQKIDPAAATDSVDLAVSLHACDTATDAALAYAVGAQAKVILAAPCCQHELYSQVQANPLATLLRHGILKERFSALATDALRGSALEAAGYRTQVMEFIDLEHTPKNLLLRAVRRMPSSGETQRRQRHFEEYQQLKNFCGAPALATDTILEAIPQSGESQLDAGQSAGETPDDS